MNLFVMLSIILVVATALAGLMRLLKQPIVIGYILTGLLLGPQAFGLLRSTAEVAIFSQMGIAILLFIVGLHLSPHEVKSLGKNVFLMGILQVVITSGLGFLLASSFGFSPVEGVYFGLALSFSSTIVVLKYLADKKDLEKLYGRIAIGVLLFQDIVAAFALVFSSAFSNGYLGIAPFLLLLIKNISLILVVSLLSYYVLPLLSSFFARSSEFLFIFSLAWGFGLASLFGYLGFSIEMGALIAGVALSTTPYCQEISSRLKPLRDFFVVIFFIVLGSQIDFASFSKVINPLIFTIIFVVVAKPFVLTLLAQLFGYNTKTAFLSGVSLSQTSEFSLILVMLGVKVGHVRGDVLSLITMVGFISIASSTYLIKYSERIYPIFLPFLKIFGRRVPVVETIGKTVYDVVLFGCNRSGYDFLHMFKEFGDKFLAVDFDPDIIKELQSNGFNCVYGDAEDAEFLEDIEIGRAKIVISTIPDYEANSFLVSKIRNFNPDTIVILISYSIDDAISLYENGATYVILPHFISGEFAARLTLESGFDINKLHQKRDEHMMYLKQRRALGYAHPVLFHH